MPKKGYNWKSHDYEPEIEHYKACKLPRKTGSELAIDYLVLMIRQYWKWDPWLSAINGFTKDSKEHVCTQSKPSGCESHKNGYIKN